MSFEANTGWGGSHLGTHSYTHRTTRLTQTKNPALWNMTHILNNRSSTRLLLPEQDRVSAGSGAGRGSEGTGERLGLQIPLQLQLSLLWARPSSPRLFSALPREGNSCTIFTGKLRCALWLMTIGSRPATFHLDTSIPVIQVSARLFTRPCSPPRLSLAAPPSTVS